MNSNCKLLPTILKFLATNKTIIRGITSVNIKFFHIALVECHNFKGTKVKISAPEESPNTDRIHIEQSTSVYFSQLGPEMTTSLLDKEILKSPLQASTVDLTMALGTLLPPFPATGSFVFCSNPF